MAQPDASGQPPRLLLEIVTPEKLLISQPVDMVIVPGSEGDFGVLPGHCPLLSLLRIGELQYKVGEQSQFVSILSGFAEVTSNKVTVLADIAEKAEEIDVDRAEAAVARAEERLERGGLPSDVEEAKISREKARLRKKIAERAGRERPKGTIHS
ncbi:MAG: F0F1 ATP synthase subunit epsilon [Nitrospiraceae bacterium]